VAIIPRRALLKEADYFRVRDFALARLAKAGDLRGSAIADHL
jgi:hypothetical protein